MGDVAGQHHLYFETGAVIAALILLGRYFEARSRGQAGEAIEKLMELGAKTARLIRRRQSATFRSRQVKAGDVLLVRPARKSRWMALSCKAVPASMKRC